MTTRPHLNVGTHLLKGTAAVLLFGVMAATIVATDFGESAGFPGIDNVTAAIGYAMFDIPADVLGATGTETFLVAFIVIAFVLDAALEGAVFLARREEDDRTVSALRSLGGDDDS